MKRLLQFLKVDVSTTLKNDGWLEYVVRKETRVSPELFSMRTSFQLDIRISKFLLVLSSKFDS